MVAQAAAKVDPQARSIGLADGSLVGYDRLVLAPGIDMRFDALPGYDEAAAAKMPHAWKAGEQTILLRRQIEAMDDGGVVVIAVPAAPLRCPPAPYERASLIAHYLKNKKPRSKILILDAKDSYPQQRLFENAWKELYPGMIERIALSQGGRVTSVDPATNTIVTDFGNYTAQVANVIPPHKAGRIAEIAGAADRTGWCPIDPVTFASKLVPNIHVIGDACFGGSMPKSAFAAQAQAKACAAAIVTARRQDAGDAAAERRLLQHRRARLRVFAGRRLSAEGRTVRGSGGAAAQPGRCAARGPRARGRRTRASGSRPSRGTRLARSQVAYRRRCWLLLFCPARPPRKLCSPIRSSAMPFLIAHGHAGDAARGRALVVDRSSTCILCHSGPFPEQKFQGDLAPDLAGSGSRWSEGQLRLRLVDASRLNAATIMPSYYRVDGSFASAARGTASRSCRPNRSRTSWRIS